MHLILTKEIVIEFTSDMSYGLPISEVHLRDCQRILVTFLGEEKAKLTANRDWSAGIVIRLASRAFIYYFKVVSQVSNDWNDCHGSVFGHSSRISDCYHREWNARTSLVIYVITTLHWKLLSYLNQIRNCMMVSKTE